MNLLITFVSFVALFALIYKLGLSVTPESKIGKKRISELMDVDESFLRAQQDFVQEKSGYAKFLDAVIALTGVDVEAKEAELQMTLHRAGISSPNAVSVYLFFNRFGFLIAIGIFTLLYFTTIKKAQGALFLVHCLLTGIICTVTAFISKMYVSNLMEKRKRVLVRAFPDGLDLLLVCVESGLALDAALARVCKELEFAHPELTKEFNKTRLELTLMNDRERALYNLGDRTDLGAFRSLVAALLQSEKFGTSLVETLRVLSDDYRQTRISIAEEKAGRLPALMTIPLVTFMLPALLIIIMSPAIMGVMKVWK